MGSTQLKGLSNSQQIVNEIYNSDLNSTTSNESKNDTCPDDEDSLEGIIDITKLKKLNISKRGNSLLGYLNRNKVVELRPIVQELDFTVLTVAETKLDNTFPSTDGFI